MKSSKAESEEDEDEEEEEEEEEEVGRGEGMERGEGEEGEGEGGEEEEDEEEEEDKSDEAEPPMISPPPCTVPCLAKRLASPPLTCCSTMRHSARALALSRCRSLIQRGAYL